MMFTSANDRPNVPNIAVFFTDGKATDKKQLFEAANEAKSKGLQVPFTYKITTHIKDLANSLKPIGIMVTLKHLNKVKNCHEQ